MMRVYYTTFVYVLCKGDAQGDQIGKFAVMVAVIYILYVVLLTSQPIIICMMMAFAYGLMMVLNHGNLNT